MNIPWMRDYKSSIVQELIRYEELEIQVKQLTGYNFNCLLELFKRGYSIEPPNYEGIPTMSELAESMEEDKE